MAFDEWKRINRYGKSNPISVWTKDYVMKSGKKRPVSITMTLYGSKKMIWELNIGKPSGFHIKKRFKTDELAQEWAKKYMEMN